MPTSLSIVRKFFPDVEKVENARKSITVAVLPQDLKGAGVKKHRACVMAAACKRALHLDGAVVSVGTIYLVKDEVAQRYQVPQSLSREIIAFDRGGDFSPGEYALHKPPVIAPRGSGRRHKGDPRAGNKPARHMTGNIRASLTTAP